MKKAPVMGTSEPTWDIAHLFPHQGAWSEEEYLELPSHRLVEFSHGFLEILPMPTESHQLIVAFLYQLLATFIRDKGLGLVLFAPLRVRLWPGKYREPDLVFMRSEHADRRHEQYWEAPDLVMEVVSPDYRAHDWETKRREYAQAGIPEYWIIDSEQKKIAVLILAEGKYDIHGIFTQGMVASSVCLPGFQVIVDEVLAIAH